MSGNPLSPPVWSGARLRDHRQRAGLSQTKLAYAAKCSSQKLSAYERDVVTPALGTAVALADALGVKVDDLLIPAGDRA